MFNFTGFLEQMAGGIDGCWEGVRIGFLYTGGGAFRLWCTLFWSGLVWSGPVESKVVISGQGGSRGDVRVSEECSYEMILC